MPSGAAIHPDTTIGAVHLTVSDLDRSLAFYRERLGLRLHHREDSRAVLGVGGPDLLLLTEAPGARRAVGTTGLYHFALLVPSRLDLAHALRRIADTQTPVQGFADHGVSEAIYLADPDGNGIEIYRDRSRDEWPWQDGKLQMVTDPLDIDSLLGQIEEGGELPEHMHPAAVMGHIHLHVADLTLSEAFYRDVLGFDLMQYFGRSAAFLSAGGYHHHIGINIWAGVGAPPPPADAAGLRWFEVCLPAADAFREVTERVHAAGVPAEQRPDGLLIHDPAHNGILLKAA